MARTSFGKPYLKELDDVGILWVRTCLGGGETLSQLVLSKVDLNNGHVYVIVASHEHQDALAKAQSLGQAAADNASSAPDTQLPILFKRLRQLEKTEGPLAIISEEDISYPSELVRKLPQLPVYQYSDRYIYIKKLSDLQNSDDLSYLMDQVVGHTPNAFVISLSDIPKDTLITDADALKLADSIIAIINPAYHFETYTLWIQDKNHHI